jgi:hypothetical protein
MIGVMVWFIGLLERDRGDWTDGLKGVVSLDDFLQHDPADRTLAPNEDEEIQTELLTNLEAIAAREDVLEVSVGLHDEEGYVSDQVLIKSDVSNCNKVHSQSAVARSPNQSVSSSRSEVVPIIRIAGGAGRGAATGTGSRRRSRPD